MLTFVHDFNLRNSLWANREFLEMQSSSMSFCASEGATIPYELFNDEVKVGYIGPYSGAYSENDSPLTLASAYAAYSSLIDVSMGRRLMVRPPIFEHFPVEGEVNLLALKRLGFLARFQDCNSTVLTKGDFRSKYNRNRKRDFAKIAFNNLVIEDGFPESAYRIIKKNRDQNGIGVSMSWSKLQQNIRLFPNIFGTRICKIDSETIAGLIYLRVNPALNYVYLWGHDKEHSQGGLALFKLADSFFDESKLKGVSKVCLGVSSVAGKVNEGLLRFKESLGAITSYRTTLEYIP